MHTHLDLELWTYVWSGPGFGNHGSRAIDYPRLWRRLHLLPQKCMCLWGLLVYERSACAHIKDLSWDWLLSAQQVFLFLSDATWSIPCLRYMTRITYIFLQTCHVGFPEDSHTAICRCPHGYVWIVRGSIQCRRHPWMDAQVYVAYWSHTTTGLAWTGYTRLWSAFLSYTVHYTYAYVCSLQFLNVVVWTPSLLVSYHIIQAVNKLAQLYKQLNVWPWILPLPTRILAEFVPRLFYMELCIKFEHVSAHTHVHLHQKSRNSLERCKLSVSCKFSVEVLVKEMYRTCHISGTCSVPGNLHVSCTFPNAA